MLIPPTGTILIIDDQAMARKNVRRTLEYYGHTVLEGDDGRSGLQIFNQEQARIDLVFLSLTMSGTPGEKIMAALRTLKPQVKMAVFTDQSTTELKAKEEFKNLVGIIRKPVSTDSLLAAVRRGLEA